MLDTINGEGRFLVVPVQMGVLLLSVQERWFERRVSSFRTNTMSNTGWKCTAFTSYSHKFMDSVCLKYNRDVVLLST